MWPCTCRRRRSSGSCGRTTRSGSFRRHSADFAAHTRRTAVFAAAASPPPDSINQINQFIKYTLCYHNGWLGSRVISVLDSALRLRRTWVQIAVATLSGNSLRQTVHTHCASVHQAAKLLAAFLRVKGIPAGLAESNGSLPPGL